MVTEQNDRAEYRLFANTWFWWRAKCSWRTESYFFSIGISSRDSRCLCFALLLNAQIDVLFIRGNFKKLNEKCRKKWFVNLPLRSTGIRVPQQWHHVQTTYWTKRHAAQWWRLREFSLQKVSRQRGTSQCYPLCQWNGNLLAARGSITCCLQTRLYINRPNLQHNRSTSSKCNAWNLIALVLSLEVLHMNFWLIWYLFIHWYELMAVNKYDLNHVSALPLMPKKFSSLFKIILWSIVSNAELRSCSTNKEIQPRSDDKSR